ncbi:MAG: HTH-type transcriptional activator Btr [Lentisphaerae bacterium ADurb.Bin242]|nr:MAG: HTH-type transcriptional activator Btr [Lentisphaerae bacterium ADurb.Bin242]
MSKKPSSSSFKQRVDIIPDFDRQSCPVYPFVVHETECFKGYAFSSHSEFTFWTVELMLSGRCHYKAGPLDFVLEPGMVLVVPPRQDISFESHSTGGAYRKLVAEFKGSGLDDLLKALGIDGVTLLTRGAASIHSLIEELRAIIHYHTIKELAALMGKTYELLHLVAANASNSMPVSTLLTDTQRRLEEDYKVTIPQLAAELGISRASLNRKFVASVGFSPARYRNRCRMEKAKLLLSSSDLSIKEIANLLGYCHQFHFSEEFKRYSGISPHRFRS